MTHKESEDEPEQAVGKKKIGLTLVLINETSTSYIESNTTFELDTKWRERFIKHSTSNFINHIFFLQYNLFIYLFQLLYCQHEDNHRNWIVIAIKRLSPSWSNQNSSFDKYTWHVKLSKYKVILPTNKFSIQYFL